jgi:hypothetical protein
MMRLQMEVQEKVDEEIIYEGRSNRCKWQSRNEGY